MCLLLFYRYLYPMFFPIGDTNVQGGYKPIFSYSLIAVNILIFIYQFSLGTNVDPFVYEYAAIPDEISRGEDYFTLFTSMFLHGGWMHLIGNMVFLWIFADNIEATIGSALFIVFYILGGLAGAAAHIVTDLHSQIPTIGASGAISAVMGAYLVMFPKSKIKVIAVFFVFWMPAVIFLVLWFGQQALSGIGELSATTDEGGTAWWAHIGGFVFGVICGLYFRRYKKPEVPDYV